MTKESPVTDYLHAWNDGEPKALEDLMALVYTELRAMSRNAMRADRETPTLNPTALVHEVYMRLASLKRVSWENRKPFFAFAARLMRRVLVEHARASKALKRGGDGKRVDLELAELPDGRHTIDALELDDILSRLEAKDPFLGQLIELRFFSGLTEDEAAEALGVPKVRVQREWRAGRRLLANMLRGDAT